MNDIPEEVRLAFALRKSAAEASSNGTLDCSMPNCLTTSGKPRRANKDCTHLKGPCCSTCCKRNGGCDISPHKSAPASGTPSTATASALSTQTSESAVSTPAKQQYLARGLDPGFASLSLDRHVREFEMTQKLKEEQDLTKLVMNSFTAIVFAAVSLFYRFSGHVDHTNIEYRLPNPPST